MLVLLFWVVFALVVPNLSAYLATQLRPVESRDRIDARVNATWEEFQAELGKFNKENITGGRFSVRSDVRGPSGEWFPKIATRDLITRERKQNAFAEPLRIKYATKVWNMELDYLSGLKNQKHLMDYLSSVSPISVYERIISALSGADLGSFEKFIDRANGYRGEVIDYLRSRTDGFSSLSYFTVATERDIDEYTEACSEYYKARAEGRKITRKYFGLDKWEDKKWEDYPALDIRGLPVFNYEPEGLVETVRRILPDLSLLIFANLLLFLCAFVAFLRYDVR